MSYSIRKRDLKDIERNCISNDSTNDLKMLLMMDATVPPVEGANSVGA